MMDDTRTRDTGRLAIAVGVVAAGSAVCLATYYAVQGPFGTINDVANAGAGVLSAWLAWRLRREMSGRAAELAVGAALLGAAVTVVGSTLVVSGETGFFLAGLVSSVGFAGIGAWLVVLNRSTGVAAAWPARLRILGVVAGGLMALGVIVAPGILLRLDDVATAPAWVWIGSLGWLGTFVAYPAWALWLGMVQARPAGRAHPVPRTAVPD
jgi:drug/metabolite transporter (DMT)-like permease